MRSGKRRTTSWLMRAGVQISELVFHPRGFGFHFIPFIHFTSGISFHLGVRALTEKARMK